MGGRGKEKEKSTRGLGTEEVKNPETRGEQRAASLKLVGLRSICRDAYMRELTESEDFS